MYFESIEIENVGPIDYVQLNFPFQGDRPKPLIIVGGNGAGKSILLSHLVNSLIVGKAQIFDDGEVELGKVYKYRSPHYIKSGETYSCSSVKFQFGVEVQELQLNQSRKDFETTYNYAPARKIWTQMPELDSSTFASTFDSHQELTSKLYKKQCCVYFPANRFEEPAWLNLENLKSKVNYTDLKHISRYSNRRIVCTSPLKDNKDWLLDLIFDRQVYEMRVQQLPQVLVQQQPAVMLPIFAGYSGQATNIYEAVLQVLKVILQDSGNIRLGAGPRKNRQIAVMKDERPWVPNLFQLSTGEVQLLNLFLSIVRDYDLSEGELNNLSDIKGIAIIDEIDSHLHAVQQREVLPELIASFPNVQFIVTTHSPLFLIGMERKFGGDGFDIIDMPRGTQVAVDDFSEFNSAYESFRETARHRREIMNEIERNSKPIVFVEGDYDIRYIIKAAQLLNRVDLLDKVQLREGGGFGGLDKIWRSYDNRMSEVLAGKIILLYDCDTKKNSSCKGRVFKRVIPSVSNNPIEIGIENLLSASTIDKVEAHNQKFIDTYESSSRRVRGTMVEIPSRKCINSDEKGNVCSFLCAEGVVDDFEGFAIIFNMIDEIVN